jgi:hypothetical protein
MSAPRRMLDVGLAIAGLFVGMIAGLFVADWLGWVPQLSLC